MLDDNLPTFFLKASPSAKHHRELYLSYHGSEPAPTYSVRHLDPAATSPHHRNCYAAALFDSHHPDILYAEVVARPVFSPPTLAQEEDVRRHGGLPPPPLPNLPHDFVVQLYAPDQQIRVERKEGKWGCSDTYDFAMPTNSFRTPSNSTLDRGQSDPASLHVTPKVNFVWKRESKLNKDLTCYYTGKSTDDVKKKSRKDPDIIIALWRSLREMTLYEPNLSRVDLEDPRGLEMVLLLSAIVLKDVFLGGNIKDVFNVSDLPHERKLSGGGRKLSNPRHTHSIHGAPNPLGTHPVQPGTSDRPPDHAKSSSLPRLQTTPPTAQASASRPMPAPPMPDARAQWELDVETARLKAIAEVEAREEHRRRKAMEKADEAAARRLQREAEEEAETAMRRNAEIERETERLRKLYGVQPIPQRPPTTQANSSSSRGPHMPRIPQHAQPSLVPPLQSPPRRGSNGLYMQPGASASAFMMSGANPNASSLNVPGRPGKKKSFFGLRSTSDDATERQRLAKKGSAMW